MSWLQQLRTTRDEIAQRAADPWRAKVDALMRGTPAMGTAALLELLGVAVTTENARRLARTMRSLGFIPLKSRRLMPGGYRDTVTRGWTRPIRGEMPCSKQ